MTRKQFIFNRFNLLVIFITILLLFLFGFGCHKEENKNHIYENLIFTLDENLKDSIKDKKIYLTSIGQSIDILNLVNYLDQLGITNYEYNPTLLAGDCENGSYVFCVVGCSIKAMGETGTSVNSEKERALEFVDSPNELTIITWHLGGTFRRGETSDSLIQTMIQGSNQLIFLKSGNNDFFLSDCAIDNNIPMYELTNISDVKIPLKYFFGCE